MSILICESLEHAEVVDAIIAEAVRDWDGTHCTRWSGTFTDGTRFGVLWGEPATSLFGLPEEGGYSIEESSEGWTEVQPEQGEEYAP